MASIKHDAGWTFGSTFFGSLSQLLLMVIVARQFDQATLGIFALLSIAIALLGYLQDLGLSTYTVHRQDLTAADRANLHWISIMLGFFAMLACLVFAPLSGWIYQSEQLNELLLWLSPQFFLLGVANQYQAELIQQGKLSLLAKIDVLSKALGLFVSIALLSDSHPDLTALVFGQLATSILRMLLLWRVSTASLLWLSPINPRLCKDAIRFGLYQSGSQVIGFLRNRADQLIIGKLLGLEALGLYSLARDIIQQPARLLGPVIQRVLLPRFAKDTGSGRSDLYQQSLKFNLQINTVIYAILSLLSWPLVWLIFGEVYLPAAALICAFSLYGMIKPTGTVLSTYSQGIGRADIEFRWNLIASVWMVSLITLAAMTESLLLTALMLSAVQYGLSCYAQHFFAKQFAAPANITLWRLSFPYVVITILVAIFGVVVSASWADIGRSFS